jgi:hypothetical protein
MINLDWSVDYTCKTKSTDVTYNEFKLMVDCIAKNDINNYLEVGVWQGATLYNLVKLFKLNGHNLKAYGYDCFEYGAPPEIDNSHTSGWPFMADVADTVSELGNVELIAGDAGVIDTIITDKKFDFVFHDANHTKDAIMGDLLALKNILNPNAFVAVHNSSYDEPHRKFFGKTAIDQLEAEGHFKVIGTADTATLLQLL